LKGLLDHIRHRSLSGCERDVLYPGGGDLRGEEEGSEIFDYLRRLEQERL
jgi:hypothetical protein